MKSTITRDENGLDPDSPHIDVTLYAGDRVIILFTVDSMEKGLQLQRALEEVYFFNVSK